jgi:hypothetical protein
MVLGKNVVKCLVIMVVIALAVPIMMALEAGTAKLTLAKDVFISGTEIKAGQYDIKWEATGQDVVFIPSGKTEGIKVQGKVEQVDKKIEQNSMMTGKDSAGREALKQVQIKGKNVRIQFE